MSLRDDKDWAINIYEERARAVENDQDVIYFFLTDYEEICRYMRTIGQDHRETGCARTPARKLLLTPDHGTRKGINAGYRSPHLSRSHGQNIRLRVSRSQL